MMKLIKYILIIYFGISVSAFAQEYKLSDKLSTDKNIRIGKLSNGLTYYIRKNALPKDRVELRLAIKAGSVLEDEDQRGLAHFTEHMAFNGTKHFKKNDLISYLQSVGIKFGKDLNAYTSFDETVYRLLVPTVKNNVVDSAFLVLEDWAHNLNFDTEEIENERGVITEEWRIGRGASQRMQDNYFPVIFHNSKYGQRLPIGKVDIIKNFKPETLRRFYADWYRPDLMAVIAVGDIDVDAYEAKIKEHFNGIPVKVNPKPRPVFDVPSHPSTLFSINSDKEATQTQLMIYTKVPNYNETTLGDYRDFVIEQMFHFVLNQRLGDLARGTEPPFISAKSSFQSLSPNKKAFLISGRLNDNEVGKGLKAILEEVEKVKRYGFTETELERAKKSIMLKYQRAYNDREKSPSEGYASELLRNYLSNEAIPGIDFEYNFVNKELPGIKLSELNDFDNSFLIDSSRVIIVNCPDKDGVKMPLEEELRTIVNNVAGSQLNAYQDKSVSFEWPGKKPVAGSIVKSKFDKKQNVTTLFLSNGVKVVLKPTKYKNNEINLVGYSKGGHNLYSNDDYFSALYASALVGESGIANLTKEDINKAFVGKEIHVSPFLDSKSEGISGKSSEKDVELLFQLTNLYFTQPKIDSVAALSFLKKTKSNLATIKLNPQKYFEDQISRLLTNNSLRGGGIPNESDLDKINPKRSLEIFRERFANAGDFTFIFVGSFNVEELKPLIETYFASMPTTSVCEEIKDLGIRPPSGKIDKVIHKGKDHKSNVSLIFTGEQKFTTKDEYLLKSLNDVLTIKFTENLREKKSGVYGVRSGGKYSKTPYPNYIEQISFQCSPENVDTLINAVFDEINKVKNNGVEAKDLNKVKLAQKNELELSLKTNAYWINELAKSIIYNSKISDGKEDFKLIESLNSKDLQKFINRVFGNNYIRATLLPEEK